MNGILDPVEHARIIQDMERISMVAGIQGRFLYQSMTHFCSQEEVDWVLSFHKHRTKGIPGLVLNGIARPDTRCQAIAAALIRNYIDARVMPLNMLLDLQNSGDAPFPTVMLIPNLFIEVVAVGKGSISAWKIQSIYDLLLQRSVRNKPTVVYVESMEALKKSYGAPFHDFLSNFKISNSNKISSPNGNGVE